MNVVRTRTRVVWWLPAVCLMSVLALAPLISAQAVSGSLSVTPGAFYGGQAVTFSGDMGMSGRRKVWLEFHMNRPGDSWSRISGSDHYTSSSGRFSFNFPARGMLDISLRVATRGSATPSVLFQAHDQSVALSVLPLGGLPLDLSQVIEYLRYVVLRGVPFLLRVDAAPGGEPVLEGRSVTLQKRTASGSWQTVATGAVDHRGYADFKQVIVDTSAVVYRARLGKWTVGGSRMGWFPSFPTEVRVLL